MWLGFKPGDHIDTRVPTGRDRGQSVPIGVLRMFISLVFGALLVIVLSRPFDQMTSYSQNATGNQTAMQAVQYNTVVWNNLPFFFLLLVGFGLIALVVFRRP